ncbi:4Fe-4S dicluster domain-containing protein [Sphingobium fluviale]|uniref:Oxidoreductase n=1 Tax=Sphingobium fluviale TaxID=2506423 RepID=A0A4Q1KFR4_9SPHN|nr:4Fe-4S dicluster domain-containing protein [Sphingobium fluviale]RXR28533.1 oxidoreductase [Sphingobium fluviale]
MKKWNLIVDVEKCENCYNCFVATKDEHVGNDFPGYAAPQPEHGHEWIRLNTFERGEMPMAEANFMPTMCNHCDEPACMKLAQNGAVQKRPDGIVIIDPVRSKGQRAIVDACPYGAIFWNEELEIPQAWIFDAHLLDQGWTKPRAEQVCPTGAISSAKISDEDMAERVAQENLRVLKPELGTKPRIYYKNLHLTDSLFVGGTVVDSKTDDCVEGAEIRLLKGEAEIATTRSDCFGEFRVDGLPPDDAAYRLELSQGDRVTTHECRTSGSLYLGIIRL